MPLLEARGLQKSFSGVRVLHGLDLTLEPGRVLGLVGENGSGKSTSMNILGGVFPPDGGTITLLGAPYAPRSPRDAHRAGLAFIHQELNYFPNLSIEENLFIASFPRWGSFLPLIHRRRVREQTRALLAEVDLALRPATPMAALSQGEKQLVEIAKALGGDARIIIFDEPTTSLTSRESERLFALIRRLRARGIAMIYISHVLNDVLRLCDDVTVLRDGAMVGHCPAAEMTVERMITLMVGRTIDQLFPARPAAPTPGTPLLEVRGVSQPGMVRDVSFTLHRGEVLGLSGLLGSGRSELAQILFGLAPHAAGEIVLDGRALRPTPARAMRAGLAFLTEDRRVEGLLDVAPIAENVALPSLREFAAPGTGLLRRRPLGEAVGQVARDTRVRAADLHHQPVRSLSGGNQQKVVLAKWLLRAPKVFILDEPTRGIDVGAKVEIYQIINRLVAEGAGILLISSELEELVGMCDRILVMSRGELSGEFRAGNFERESLLRAAMRQPPPTTGAAHPANP